MGDMLSASLLQQTLLLPTPGWHKPPEKGLFVGTVTVLGTLHEFGALEGELFAPYYTAQNPAGFSPLMEPVCSADKSTGKKRGQE